MGNITKMPLQDGFETTLAQGWNGVDTTIYVQNTPSFTFPSGVTTFLVVDPGLTSMQVVECTAYDSVLKTFTVTATTTKKGNGVNYAPVSHAAGSMVRISDNFEFWEEIKDVIATKADTDLSNVSEYVDTYARDTALGGDGAATKNYRMIKAGSAYYNYNLSTGQRQIVSTGTAPSNASQTLAGIVEIATDAEVASGTNTGGTGAQLVTQPSQLKTTNDAITTLSSNIGSKQFTYGETIAARDVVSLIPDGTTNGRIYKYIGSSGLQTAFSSTGTPRAYQGCISLSNSLFVTGYVGGAPNGTAFLCAATVSGNTFTWGTALQYDVFFSGFSDTNIVGYDLVTLSSTTFAAIAVYFSPTNNQKYVAARAFSVSGTTITAGTQVTIHNPGTATISYSGSCLIDTNKVAISYVYNSSNHMVAFTVSGTTVTSGTPSAGFGTQGKMCQVATDKIAVSDGSNVRLVTFTGTTPVLGNNLAIGSTYTPRSIRNIGSSFAIFTGTTGGNAQAFIVDCSGATPTKGTTVTVLASSTSDDGILINNGHVVVLTDSSTSNTKYYYYSYTGTTLSLLHTVTTTGVRTGYGMIAQISNLTAISAHHTTTGSPTQCIFMSDRKYYCQGIAKESGIANDIKYVFITGGIVTGYTGLVPGLPYNATSSGIATTGDFFIAKSVSSTEVQVILSLNTL